jgi:hypothetical protein
MNLGEVPGVMSKGIPLLKSVVFEFTKSSGRMILNESGWVSAKAFNKAIPAGHTGSLWFSVLF